MTKARDLASFGSTAGAITPTSVSVGSGSYSISGNFVYLNAVDAVNIDGIFSSNHSVYRITCNLFTSSNTIVRARFRASNATDSTANYYYQQLVYNSSTLTGARSLGDTNYKLGNVNNQRHGIEITVINPYQAEQTYGFARVTGGADSNISDVRFVTGTQFDGIRLYPDAGTITGNIYIASQR